MPLVPEAFLWTPGRAEPQITTMTSKPINVECRNWGQITTCFTSLFADEGFDIVDQFLSWNIFRMSFCQQ